MKKSLGKSEFIDTLYSFRGRWGVPSLCGLKVVKGMGRHVIIVTDLYERNPGTSVTDYCAELASLVCGEYELDQGKVVFIEHCPDRGSKLENYRERFDRVGFSWNGERFSDPDWNEIGRNEVMEIIKEEEDGAVA
jgi:hypothetical protein